MKLKIETITPQVAAEMLKKNTGNFRSCDMGRVALYAKEMQAGRWELNGETIKFNGTKLIDGQTRLNAVIRSGVTIQSAVAYEIEADGVSVDKGKPRTVAQWLTHDGRHKNTNHLAAVARMCLLHECGRWSATSLHRITITPTEIIDYCNNHQVALEGAIKLASPCKKVANLSSVAALLAVGSGMKDPSLNETALWFSDKLATGVALNSGEPVLALRNALQKNGNKTIGLYMARMLMTIAWNKTVEGKKCSVLRLTLVGPSAQEPPNEVLVASEAFGQLWKS